MEFAAESEKESGTQSQSSPVEEAYQAQIAEGSFSNSKPSHSPQSNFDGEQKSDSPQKMAEQQSLPLTNSESLNQDPTEVGLLPANEDAISKPDGGSSSDLAAELRSSTLSDKTDPDSPVETSETIKNAIFGDEKTLDREEESGVTEKMCDSPEFSDDVVKDKPRTDERIELSEQKRTEGFEEDGTSKIIEESNRNNIDLEKSARTPSLNQSEKHAVSAIFDEIEPMGGTNEDFAKADDFSEKNSVSCTPDSQELAQTEEITPLEGDKKEVTVSAAVTPSKGADEGTNLCEISVKGGDQLDSVGRQTKLEVITNDVKDSLEPQAACPDPVQSVLDLIDKDRQEASTKGNKNCPIETEKPKKPKVSRKKKPPAEPKKMESIPEPTESATISFSSVEDSISSVLLGVMAGAMQSACDAMHPGEGWKAGGSGKKQRKQRKSLAVKGGNNPKKRVTANIEEILPVKRKSNPKKRFSMESDTVPTPEPCVDITQKPESSTPKKKAQRKPGALGETVTPDLVVIEDSPKNIDRPKSSSPKIEVITPGLDTKLFPPSKGIHFVVGERLQARDELGDWYSSKIVRVDPKRGKVRIHFQNWNSRHDIWLHGTSDGLKRSTDADLEGRRKNVDEELSEGDYVFAKWPSSSGYFPARVQSVEETGYNLTYYDGFERITKRRDIRKMTADEIKENVDEKTFGTKLVVLPEIPNKLYDPEKVTGKRKSVWRSEPESEDQESERDEQKEGSTELVEVHREALDPLPSVKKRHVRDSYGYGPTVLNKEKDEQKLPETKENPEKLEKALISKSNEPSGKAMVSPSRTTRRSSGATIEASSDVIEDKRGTSNKSPKWAISTKHEQESPESETGSLKLVLSKKKNPVKKSLVKCAVPVKSPVKPTIRTSQRRVTPKFDVKEILSLRRRKLDGTSKTKPKGKVQGIGKPNVDEEKPVSVITVESDDDVRKSSPVAPSLRRKKRSTESAAEVEPAADLTGDGLPVVGTPGRRRGRPRISAPEPESVERKEVHIPESHGKTRHSSDHSVGSSVTANLEAKRGTDPQGQPEEQSNRSRRKRKNIVSSTETKSVIPGNQDLPKEQLSRRSRKRKNDISLVETPEKQESCSAPTRKRLRVRKETDNSTEESPKRRSARFSMSPKTFRLESLPKDDSSEDSVAKSCTLELDRGSQSPAKTLAVQSVELPEAQKDEIQDEVVTEELAIDVPTLESESDDDDEPLIKLATMKRQAPVMKKKVTKKEVGKAAALKTNATLKLGRKKRIFESEVRLEQKKESPRESVSLVAPDIEKKDEVEMVVMLEKLGGKDEDVKEEKEEMDEAEQPTIAPEKAESDGEDEESSEENEFEIGGVEIVDRGSPVRSPSPSEIVEKRKEKAQELEKRSATPTTYGSSTFQSEWLEVEGWDKWLRYDNGEMYCEPCRKFFPHSDWGFVAGIKSNFCKTRTKKHSKAWQHVKALASFLSGEDYGGKQKQQKELTPAQSATSSKEASVAPEEPENPQEKPVSEVKPTDLTQEKKDKKNQVFLTYQAGREDWLKEEGDTVYCACCRHFSSEAKQVAWSRGLPKSRANQAPVHDISMVHKKLMLKYYKEVLKLAPPMGLVPQPATSETPGLKWVKNEQICSVEGCGKSFRTAAKLSAHVRNTHPEKCRITEPPEIKAPAAVIGGVGEAKKKEGHKPKEKLQKVKKAIPKKRSRLESNSTVSASERWEESEDDVSSNDEEEFLPSSENEKRGQKRAEKKKKKKKAKKPQLTEDFEGSDRELSEEERNGTPDSELSDSDLVRCICQQNEENGFMLQCDQCMTWQHGECFDIPNPNSVPQEYVCYVCKNPRGLRESCRYRDKTREIWIKDGMLPELVLAKKYPGQIFTAAEDRASAVRKTNLLNEQSVKLTDRLKAVRHRMHMAAHPRDCSSQLNNYAASVSSQQPLHYDQTYIMKGPSERLKAEISSMQEAVETELEQLDAHVREMESQWRKYGRLGEDSDPQTVKSDIKVLIRDLGKIRKLSHMLPS